MKTLELFNAVVEKKSRKKPFVSKDGYIIQPGALWAKDRIVSFYKKESLNGNDLNKTFHKSWKKIKESSREELFIHQILHYLSTYGTSMKGEIYIPDEIVKIPDTKIVFKVVRAYTKDQLIEKSLGMLRSGMALKGETIDDLISVLDGLGYSFTGSEGIRNKEAVVKIADLYGVAPQDFMGFFRYILYRSTGKPLIIKNKETIQLIKDNAYNPSIQFKKFGLEKLSENFNRFKPLFLAYKKSCPKVINRISKLSKINHKPMVQNPLNLVTQRKLSRGEEHWLDNATPYALFKALSATWNRLNGQDVFLYKIRNGKSYVKENTVTSANEFNYDYLIKYLKKRFSLKGKKIHIPEDIVYALPTSEKMYVGNIPMGTKFYGDKLAVGIYWENSWGAFDLDLSSQDLDGKIGWNSLYNRGVGSLMFSGDITNAPNGAVEYLYAHKRLENNALIFNNVYSGKDESEFKIIVGKGDNIDRNFMMNPNKLFMEVKVKSVQKQSIIGLLIPGEKLAFVLLNFGSGHARVSKNSRQIKKARIALKQEWSNTLSFNAIARLLGARFVKKEKADIDLSLNSLEKDSFMKVFN